MLRAQLEVLEDRTVPSAGEWLLRLEGLPNTTIEEQMEAARELIEAAHIEDVEIEVVDHAVLDGNIVIEAPPATPLAVLTQRLSVLPGFLDVQPFVGEDEGEAPPADPAPDGSGPLALNPGPASEAPGTNLNVGLVGNEPTIAVNPVNPNNVVVGQFNNGAQTLRISLDGGATFPIVRNGVLVSGQTFFQGDDSLAFDAQGRLFWSYLSGGTPSGPNVTVVQINSITGAVVGSPTLVATTNLDKEWLAADRNLASPFANNLYVAWHDFAQVNAPVRFARSTNQGVTWTTLAGNLSGANEGFTWPCEVAVAPNGDVWVAWHTNTGGTNGEVRMRRSTDGGVTFGAEIIPFPAGTGATTTNSATGLANKITGLHVWLQGSMQPRILIDPVRPGNIYVVSVDDPDTFTPTDDPSDIVIARSTNNGATWTRSTISQGVYGDSEFMPAAGIDANGNIAVTWYTNRRHLTVTDSLGGTHDLLDVNATGSLDGGLTFSAPFRVNDTANTFDPERGAPDRFSPNHVLRVGEYNGLSVVNGTGYAVWTGNTATGQQIQFDKFSINVSYQVVASVPLAGQVVATAPTDFVIQLNGPVNPATVQPSDLTVNGIPANSFIINGAGDTITFYYNSTPVTVQGLQSMALSAGAVASATGAPVQAFAATFRYDIVPLTVTATTPAPGGIFTLPGPFTFDVLFNEDVSAASVGTGDLLLSFGTVTAATRDATNFKLIHYTLGGISAEGTLTITVKSGELTDTFGNPNPAAFTAAYQVDFGTVPYPTPLAPESPIGSLIYDPSVSGLVNFVGDTDSFTLNVDAGQTITVLVDPVGSPDPALYGGVGNGAGTAAGQLLLIDQTSGASTVVGDPVTPGGLSGLVFDPSAGVFFGTVVQGTTNASTLVRIDPDTGALLGTVGTVRVGSVAGPTIPIGDLAIQPGTNVLFAVRSNAGSSGFGELYTINKTTAVATLIGSTGSGAGGGLAFAPDGSLYQTAFNSGFDFPSLNKINPATAARISTVPLPGIYFDGLAVRPTDGVIFAAQGSTGTAVYTINPTTGAVTLVGNTSATTSDIAFRSTTALAPTVELRNPGNALVASNSAGAGLNALLQTVPVTTGGTYKITVGGAAGTTGGYTVRVILNAALEAEGTVAGVSNNTRATAQDLGPSFLTLQTSQVSAQRGAVVGQFAGDDDFYAFTLAAGQSATLAMTATGTSTTLFGTRSDLAGFDGPISVAYGDLNGDGKQDMVTANYNPGTVSVLLGNGNGTFGAATTYSLAAANPWTVVLGDVNGDGRRDIVTSNIGSGTVSVLLGNGTGGFGAATAYAMGTAPYGVAVGDLNGDGRDDVVSANYNTNDVTVRLGQASGVLAAPTSYAVSGSFFGPVAVALGDFNGDNKLDVVSANYGGNNISVLLGNGLGALGSPVAFAMGTNPFSIALGDLNGDGRTDVVTGNNGGTDVSVRFGDGVGGFGALATYASGGGNPIRVAVGDLNGDGRRDIAVSNLGSNTVGVLLNTGGGSFGAAQSFATGTDPYGIALPDLNGDGLPDLSTANYSTNNVSVWLNATVQVQLQLQNSAGAVLATGTPATNFTAGINNFVAPTAGTYYARVFGGGTASYNLVVTRDAVFDTESNDTPAAAQSLGGARAALGAVQGSSTVTLTALDSGWYDLSGFHDPTNENYFTGLVGGNELRNWFAFNLAGLAGQVVGAQLKLTFPANGYGSADPSETYTLFDVSTPVAQLQAGGSGQVARFNDLGTGSSYGSRSMTAADNGTVVTVPLNAAAVAAIGAAAGGQFALGGALTSIAGTADQFVFSNSFNGTTTRQLVLTFADQDWYSVTLGAGQSGLQVETVTPADGAGEFVNTLNPKIEVYNSTGTVLLASGISLADGRNEKALLTGLTPGATYKIKVTGESLTGGEYLLTATPLRTPTVTTQMDDATPLASGPDGSFMVPAGKGWTNQTGAGYLNDRTVWDGTTSPGATNFANWTIRVTPGAGGSFELFTTWVPNAANATNATYQVYEGTTLRATVVVNQQFAPSDGVLFGNTLVKSLGTFTKLNAATTFFSVRLLTAGANGRVVADGVFDPPAGGDAPIGVPPSDPVAATPAAPAAALVLPTARADRAPAAAAPPGNPTPRPIGPLYLAVTDIRVDAPVVANPDRRPPAATTVATQPDPLGLAVVLPADPVRIGVAAAPRPVFGVFDALLFPEDLFARARE